MTEQTSSKTSSKLDRVRTQKISGGVETDIAKVEGAQLVKAENGNVGSVNLEGGTFYKLPSGTWRGPGGNYGPSTNLGKKLEAAFATKS